MARLCVLFFREARCGWLGSRPPRSLCALQIGYAEWFSPVDRTSTLGHPLPAEVARKAAEDASPKTPEETDADLGEDGVFYAHLTAQAQNNLIRVFQGAPYWYLVRTPSPVPPLLDKRLKAAHAQHILAIVPEYQRKGAGTKLLRWGLDKADEAGVPAYLEASPTVSILNRLTLIRDMLTDWSPFMLGLPALQGPRI